MKGASGFIRTWIDPIGQDARYALRTFTRAPGFTAVVVLTLSIGIGATTAIFSVVNNLLLTPPPFPDANRLMTLVDTHPTKVPPDAETPPSPGNVLDWRERARSFDQIALWRNWYYAVGAVDAGPGTPETVRGVRVSPQFFPMLGVQPALGRLFRDEEEVPGADAVVLLTDALWRRRFAADPAIVGRAILVDGRPTTVVGVLPRGFQVYQPDLELWMPLPMNAGLRVRDNHSTMAFARLAPNVTIDAAQRELSAIASELEAEHPDTNAGWGARIVPLYPTRESRDVRPALAVLLGAAAFVLLIACVNVANLLFARAIARRREMAVRAALGASRSRLLFQMGVESLLLAAAGAAGGVLVARWAIPPLVTLLPHAGTNRTLGLFDPELEAIDARTLGFVLATAVGTGLLFGVMPALQSTAADAWQAIRLTTRASAKRALMIAELALSVVLLVSAALLLESFWRLQQVNPGFHPDHLLTMQIELPRQKYTTPADYRIFFDRARQAIDALPGVVASAGVSFRPFLGMAMSTRIDVDGRAAADANFAGYAVITPGYLRVLGQPLVRGREFGDADDEHAGGVAIVNETMAKRYWPNQDPIGRLVRPAFSRTDVPWAVDAQARWLTVVGVAADIKEFRLDEQTRPLMYVAHGQFPLPFQYWLVRTTVPPASIATAVQRRIAAIDRDQPIAAVRTMDEAIAQAVPRFNVALFGAFALIALLLSAVGVYGVMSFIVGQRTQEIGVRMALGATARRIMTATLGEVAALGLVGVGAGVVAALALTRVLETLLFGVAPTDARAFAAAAVLLLAVALGACYVPARRATRVDPTVALRCE